MSLASQVATLATRLGVEFKAIRTEVAAGGATGTKVSALTSATSLDGTETIPIVQAGTSKKIAVGDAGVWLRKALASDAAANSTTTTAKITSLDQALPIGTYQFQYFIRYQSSVTTTGVKFDVNFTGTVSAFVWNQRWVDVSATASTATPDQDAVIAAGSVMGSFGSRAKGTAGRGVTLGVDTINADMMMVIEGIAIVTAAGNLELWHGSETANATTVKAGSSIGALKVA